MGVRELFAGLGKGYLQLFFARDWTPVSYRDSTAAVYLGSTPMVEYELLNRDRVGSDGILELVDLTHRREDMVDRLVLPRGVHPLHDDHDPVGPVGLQHEHVTGEVTGSLLRGFAGVLLVGATGTIGQAVAERATWLGMDVWGVRRSPARDARNTGAPIE